MKPISLLILLGAFTLSPAAFAEDEFSNAMARVKANAAAQQHARPTTTARTQQPVATNRGPQQSSRGGQNPRFSSAGVPSRIYQGNTDTGGRNWRNGANWNGGQNGVVAPEANRDWRNRANTGDYNQRVWTGRNGDDSGRSREWGGRNWSGRGDWDRGRHDRGWWRGHYDRFALFGGGYYFLNNGYWYPAYGYDPYFTDYSYDAPIYAYDDQDPGQVIANVQRALQRQGYYRGSLDGTYGPMTRRALLDFQRDNGLPHSGQIDEDTLGALGMR
ncbi:MAG: peptidoglycan-binding protein [Verrucomicrobiota bacterium]|nr:peptidoglycan-binding protein [Verrucomicrobiota bacterium]